ncbi:hypothetical protein [Lancefieldella parvula]|uniref:hypothetical protein n=1 Tax=Lancefieldella parvula TaxID=1382 RepID=UPI0029076726|nr:hypothetical protein [Lancefieldella parvula]MDU4867902.1 hypothetical protein [Lancefieldella parvula]
MATSPKCELNQAACASFFHETKPELFNKSEQNYLDKARKTGKLLRYGEKIRQIIQTWRENQARIKPASDASREKNVLGARLSLMPCPTKNGPGENPGPLL